MLNILIHVIYTRFINFNILLLELLNISEVKFYKTKHHKYFLREFCPYFFYQV